MSDIKKEYIVGGTSVRGFSHIKNDKPNQDSFKIYDKDEIIISVADGHGSETYFRSDIGSKIAVNVIEEILLSYFKNFRDEEELFENEKLKEIEFDNIKNDLIDLWLKNVEEHIKENNFNLEHLNINDFPFDGNSITEKYFINEDENKKEIKKATYNSLLRNPIRAYGSTLITYSIFSQGIIIIKIGDGDIFLTNKEGEISAPFDSNDDLLANETYSLCQLDPSKIEIYYSKEVPEIVVLSTDGLSNSFTDISVVENLGLKLKEEYTKIEDVKQNDKNLSEFLNTVTKKGSGDDCTVVYYINLKEDLLVEENDHKEDNLKEDENKEIIIEESQIEKIGLDNEEEK